MSLTVPNLLSLLRMALVPLFVIAILQGKPLRALGFFIVAGLTDALDGLIARFFNQRSVLGTYLDPAADKLLLVSAYVMLAVPGLNPGLQIPIWVTVLVIARDVMITVLVLILHLALKVPSFPPSVLSKINTGAQVVAVVLVLASGRFAALDAVATAAVYIVAVLTLASGVDYVFRTNRMVAERSAA
jgi:cardiolipin synthase (CMP-forming)